MKIFLLTGNITEDQDHCSALQKVDGEFLIDKQLRELQKLTSNIEVVLGYKFADDIIRHSQLLKDFDIIFDTNEESGGIISNVKAGLYATRQPCFTIPVNVEVPKVEVWKKLIQASQPLKKEEFILRPSTPEKGEIRTGFPLFINQKTRDFLLKNDDLKDLDDQRIKYKLVSFLNHEVISQADESGKNLPRAL